MYFSVQWWDNLRDKTFDVWADKYNVTKPEIEGEDYEILESGEKVYPWKDDMFKSFDDRKNYIQESKKRRPIRWFLFHAIPEVIETVVEFPKKTYIDIKYWILYRTTRKHHIVDTKLKPGYYDADTILENAIWSILVDFVEVEAAWMSCIFDDTKRKKFKRDRLLGTLRSREMGEEYFLWHINEAGNTAENIKAKKEIYQTYLWYKDEYPKLKKVIECISDFEGYSDLPRDKRMKLLEKQHKEEEKLAKAVTKKLETIIKYRDILWT